MKPRSPGKAGNGYSLVLPQQIHLESACLSILISRLARHVFDTFIVAAVIFRGLQRLRLFVRQRPEFHPAVREFSSIFQSCFPFPGSAGLVEGCINSSSVQPFRQFYPVAQSLSFCSDLRIRRLRNTASVWI